MVKRCPSLKGPTIKKCIWRIKLLSRPSNIIWLQITFRHRLLLFFVFWRHIVKSHLQLYCTNLFAANFAGCIERVTRM